MRRHLQIEILLVPFVFTLLAALIVPARIGFSSGLVLAMLEMIAVSFPLFLRSQQPARRERSQTYFFVNLTATGMIVLAVLTVRTALLPLLR